VNGQKLIERIADEQRKIKGTVAEIKELLNKMEAASIEGLEVRKALVALRLDIFYTGLENIFERIAREIDMDEPKGEEWHKELLQQMAESRLSRLSVISAKTAAALGIVLRFCHRLRDIYVFELDPEKTAENAKQGCDIFDSLSAELNACIAYLEKQEND